MIKQEIWKPIQGYEDLYEVSNLGRVRRTELLTFWKHNGKQPYYMVGLSKNSKSKKCLVHRLVAEAFIPNPSNLPQVNHKDGNVHNNSVDNLEWCTNAENTKHAYENYLRKRNVNWIFDGEKYMTLRSVCIELGLDYKKVHCRLNSLGWDFQRAIDYKGGGRYVECKTLPTSAKCVG